MIGLFKYLFWISLYMGIVCVVYCALVRGNASPAQNRFYIMFGLIVSVLLGILGSPFSSLYGGEGTAAGTTILLPEVVVGISNSVYGGLETSHLQIAEWMRTHRLFLYVFYLPMLFLLLRFITGLVALAAMIRPGKRKSMEGIPVVPLKKGGAPFSFFGLAFIPPRLLAHPGLRYIIHHEKVHIDRMHSLDLVLVELLMAAFWFHPAMWYLRKELKLQHEFEADRCVINQLGDKSSYMKLLLEVGACSPFRPVANSFNNPPLKQRMMMMKKNQTTGSKTAVFYMLLSVPLLMALFVIQSCTDALEPEAKNTETVRASDATPDPDYSAEKVFVVVEDLPVFPGGELARQRFLGDNLNYPLSAMEEGIQGTVFVTFVVQSDGNINRIRILRGLSTDIDKEVLRVVEEMPAWEPGKQNGEAVAVQFTMPVRFTLD